MYENKSRMKTIALFILCSLIINEITIETNVQLSFQFNHIDKTSIQSKMNE